MRRAEPYTHNPQQQYRLQQQASKIQALPQQQYKLQQHTAKTQVIRPPLGTMTSPVSIQVRPLMWTTHPEGPSRNCSPCTILHLSAMSKNMGLTQICQNPAHLGLSFGVLNAKGSSSSQLHSCEPPRAIPYGVADQQPTSHTTALPQRTCQSR